MEWVEVKGPSVDVAVEAALAELGVESRDEVDVEVLQEPEKGFLGIGRTDAVVRVKPRPKKRRRGRSTGKKDAGDRQGRDKQPQRGQGQSRQGGDRQGRDKQAQSGQGRDQAKKPGQRQQQRSGNRAKPPEKKRADQRSSSSAGVGESEAQPRETTVSREEQANVVGEFLEGLLNAFGLAGTVETRVDEDIIYADVLGNETEALVGARGVILQSIHELAKTVVQRKTQESARIRLDIAGYAEHRREALKIYAQRLGQQVLAEGGEVMVEPMNAADRKVIHDTVSEIEGVRTYSEGEEPRRSVVISAE